jgi:hypothetical protein
MKIGNSITLNTNSIRLKEVGGTSFKRRKEYQHLADLVKVGINNLTTDI